MSQTEFANMIGISQTYLSQIETGSKTPNISVLESMSEKLKFPLPIIFWFSLEESDIYEEKRVHFKQIKPIIDTLINSLLEFNSLGNKT